MYVVTDWIQGSACDGADRGPWDNMVDGWFNEIGSSGWYSKDRRVVNGSLSPIFLCDPDSQAGCLDYKWIDEGDAIMLGMHGSDSGNHWRGLTRYRLSHPDCYIDAPEAGSGDLFLGDFDAEFLHLSSCNSMDDDNLPHTWRLFRDPADSPSNGGRLHLATGFHGVMFIYSSWPHYYEDFAADAFAVSIKDAWLSNLHVTNIELCVDQDNDDDCQDDPPVYVDQCPVAYAVGASKADCLSRITTERYNNQTRLSAQGEAR